MSLLLQEIFKSGLSVMAEKKEEEEEEKQDLLQREADNTYIFYFVAFGFFTVPLLEIAYKSFFIFLFELRILSLSSEEYMYYLNNHYIKNIGISLLTSYDYFCKFFVFCTLFEV